MVAVETYNSGEGNLYPKIEPYDQGMLPVGSGHSLYWEQSGNPKGEPVLESGKVLKLNKKRSVRIS